MNCPLSSCCTNFPVFFISLQSGHYSLFLDSEEYNHYKQTNKQTEGYNHTNKQTSEQASKQTNKKLTISARALIVDSSSPLAYVSLCCKSLCHRTPYASYTSLGVIYSAQKSSLSFDSRWNTTLKIHCKMSIGLVISAIGRKKNPVRSERT